MNDGALQLNDDGSIRAFTDAEIAAIEIETLGIRDGSHPVHTREYNQSTITCEYLIDPDQFEVFCAFMLGGSRVYNDEGTDRLSRLMPQRWPTKPSFAAVKVMPTSNHVFDVDDNDSADFPIPTFERMKVPILFQHMPFDLYDDLEPAGSINETRRYCLNLPSSAQIDYLTLPGGILRFKPQSGSYPPNAPIPHNVGKPLVQTVIAMKWVRVPWLAWQPNSTLFNRVYGSSENDTTICSGCINSGVFQGFQPGQLLFIGADAEIKQDPLGDYKCWDLTYKFLLKPNGHNDFFYYPTSGAGSGVWCFVTNDNTWHPSSSLPDGVSLFNARDMYTLFRVGT